MALAMPKGSPQGAFTEKLFSDIFQHAGVKLEIINCTVVQCSLYIKQGLVDGDMGRTEQFGKNFPQLQKVSEPISRLEYAAYFVNDRFKVRQLEDISATKARLAIRVEDYYLKQQLSQLNSQQLSVDYVLNWIDGLNKVVKGEVDVYMGSSIMVRDLLKNAQYHTVKESQTLVTEPVYIYLNRRNSDLLDKLAVAIREIDIDQKVKQYKSEIGM